MTFQDLAIARVISNYAACHEVDDVDAVDITDDDGDITSGIEEDLTLIIEDEEFEDEEELEEVEEFVAEETDDEE